MPTYYTYQALGPDKAYSRFHDDGGFSSGLDLLGQIERATMPSYRTNTAVCRDPYVALSFTLENPDSWNISVAVAFDRQSATLSIPRDKAGVKFDRVQIVLPFA